METKDIAIIVLSALNLVACCAILYLVLSGRSQMYTYGYDSEPSPELVAALRATDADFARDRKIRESAYKYPPGSTLDIQRGSFEKFQPAQEPVRGMGRRMGIANPAMHQGLMKQATAYTVA